MIDHASTTRRGFLRSLGAVAAATGVGATALRSGRLQADPGLAALDRAAAALDPAIRLDHPPTTTTSTTTTTMVPVESGEIVLPVDPGDGGLVCLNNHMGFSNARGPCGHRGVDIGELVDNSPGRPLLACVSGVIERDGVLGSAGNFRILRGDDGRWYRYHHLDEFADDVAEGDRVQAGQVIGAMGATGNTSWTHLHFEVWEVSVIPRDGVDLDPVPLIEFPSSVQVDPSRACEL